MISDFKAYLKLYNRLPAHREAPLPVWNNLWVKMMWSMQWIYAIDLATITRQHVIDRNITGVIPFGILKVLDSRLRGNDIV